MSPLRWKLLPIVLLALLYVRVPFGASGQVGPTVIASGGAAENDAEAPAAPVEVSLATLRRDPVAWLGRRVETNRGDGTCAA